MHGARERHVEEPHGLRGHFQPDLSLDGGERRIVIRIVVEIDHRLQRCVVILTAVGPGTAGLGRAVAEEGTENNRVLQSLACMDGDDLYQVLIRLETQLCRIQRVVFCLGRIEPAQQRLGRRMRLCRLLQFLGNVQAVGEAPFAVAPREQAPGDALIGE